MPTMFMFVHPDKLMIGEKYYLRENSVDDSIPKHKEVTFISYDSSFGFVYVANGDGIVERCAKADLFQKLVIGS